MTILSCELQCDEVAPTKETSRPIVSSLSGIKRSFESATIGHTPVSRAAPSGEARGMSYDAEVTVRIANDAAENGAEQDPGPLTWLNSARITTDPENDSVHCLVSIGDPRGAFCFTVCRRPDTGEIVLHLPYPGDTMPHEKTEELHPGTLRVVGHDGTTVSYADPEPEEEEEED